MERPTKSQTFPVPPPPKGGREYQDKESDHETKPGQKENAEARRSSNGGYPPDNR